MNAIILGATSGIGKELALLMAQQGFNVGIAGRRLHLLKQIKKLVPDKIFIARIDVTNRKIALKHLFDLIKKLGGIDLFIFSTGIGYINHSLTWTPEKKTIETNITGFTGILIPIYHYFEKQRHGHIVAISSIAGLRGNRFAPAYSASKAYQISFLQALRAKSIKNKTGIYITDIRPGFVDTAMAQNEHIFWLASPQKAAKQILKAIKSKKKVAYITHRWIIFAWFIKLLPGYIYNRI